MCNWNHEKGFCSKLLNSFLILNLLNLERAVSEFLSDNDYIKVEGKEFRVTNHLPLSPQPSFLSALIATKDTLALVSWSPEYQSWKLNAFLSHGRGWIQPSRSSTEVPLLKSSRSRPNLSSHARLLLSLPGDESVTLAWLPYFFDTVSVTAVFPQPVVFSINQFLFSDPYHSILPFLGQPPLSSQSLVAILHCLSAPGLLCICGGCFHVS